jgi:hypothetical protein
MGNQDNDPEITPAELLQRIQARFRDLGRLGERLTLSHAGRQYLASCDETAFTVYRLVTQCHLPPGRPGWPVCLVTDETMVDETSLPLAAADEFSSGLTLFEWLALIEKTFRS